MFISPPVCSAVQCSAVSHFCDLFPVQTCSTPNKPDVLRCGACEEPNPSAASTGDAAALSGGDGISFGGFSFGSTDSAAPAPAPAPSTAAPTAGVAVAESIASAVSSALVLSFAAPADSGFDFGSSAAPVFGSSFGSSSNAADPFAAPTPAPAPGSPQTARAKPEVKPTSAKLSATKPSTEVFGAGGFSFGAPTDPAPSFGTVMFGSSAPVATDAPSGGFSFDAPNPAVDTGAAASAAPVVPAPPPPPPVPLEREEPELDADTDTPPVPAPPKGSTETQLPPELQSTYGDEWDTAPADEPDVDSGDAAAAAGADGSTAPASSADTASASKFSESSATERAAAVRDHRNFSADAERVCELTDFGCAIGDPTTKGAHDVLDTGSSYVLNSCALTVNHCQSLSITESRSDAIAFCLCSFLFCTETGGE